MSLLLCAALVAAPDTLQLHVPHTHPPAVARARVGYLLDYWRDRFGVQALPAEDGSVAVKGSLYGIDFDGRIVIETERVAAIVTDPGFLVRERVAEYVARMLAKYMHPTYAEAPRD